MPVHRTPELTPVEPVAPASLARLRDLAARGRLVSATADPAVAAELRPVVYDLVWPLVWSRHTRRLEATKGHRRCASSLGRLESACLDGFHDDVEAVMTFLFRYGDKPIHNLEGWIINRLPKAVVDGYRDRRGRMGALKRVRMPKWLEAGLEHDPWLVRLACRVMEWVGVPHTAGLETWPLETWADQRAVLTGDRRGSSPDRVGAEVAHVLDTMARTRPAWYATYIDAPLGRKEAPVSGVVDPEGRADAVLAPAAAEASEAEVRLDALAAAAVEAIDDGLAAGADPEELVSTVVSALAAHAEGLDSVLVDERALAAVVRHVLAVVRCGD